MQPEISKIAGAPNLKFGTVLLKATTFIKPIICALKTFRHWYCLYQC